MAHFFHPDAAQTAHKMGLSSEEFRARGLSLVPVFGRPIPPLLEQPDPNAAVPLLT